MSRKTGQRNNEEQDEDVGNGSGKKTYEEFSEDDGFEPSYLTKLNEFIKKSQLDTSQASFYLYKFENYNSGELKAIVAKFGENEDVPDEDAVGKRFGSGRYLLMMSVPADGRKRKTTTVRSYRFRVSTIYDQQRLQQQPAPQVPVYDSGKSLMDAFTMLQGLIGTLSPLFRPVENPDQQKMMKDQYNFVGEIMRKSMTDNIQLFSDYQRKVQAIKDNRGEDLEEEPGLLEKVLPYIKEYIPLLVGGGVKGQAVAEVAKKTLMFREIKKNRAMVSALVRHLDSTQGVESTNKVLLALGMKRFK